VNCTTYANLTARTAAAARSCSWRTRGIGHVGGGSQAMYASDLSPVAFMTAPNATKRSPRRLAERLT
jgi:hypothetical protein